MQLRDARKREEERTAAEAAFLEQDARATTEERRFARAQNSRGSAPKTSAPLPHGLPNAEDSCWVSGGKATIYRDVPVTAWFAPYVSLLIEEDIAQGYKDEDGTPTGEFGVANAVTYAEVLKMALEAADIPLTGGSPRNSSAQGTWVSSYVFTAESLQLSLFTPALDVHGPATRGEVIQTILEVMRIPTDIKIPSPFTDIPEVHAHAKAITTASVFGLVEGDLASDGSSLGTFRPDEPINRAEVSKIVVLVRKLLP